MKDENRKALEEAVANADPALIEKYGNPLDPNDPRHWEPSERGARGVSINDRTRLLELDMELVQQSVARLVDHMMRQQAREFLAEMEANPEAAMKKLAAYTESIPRSYGPNGEAGPAFAGSTKGLPPDAQVETPDGVIRADQIPGYRNDPDWRPSPDWAEANCMCATHVAAREAAKENPQFPDGPTGMYL